MSELILLKAKCKFIISEYDSANILLDTLKEYVKKETDSYKKNKFLSDIYNTKGNIFSRQTNSDSAIVYFQEAYIHSSALGLSRNIVDISLNLADAYVRNGKYDMGAHWYRKSLYASDTLKIPENERFPSYYGLGQVYMELRDFILCDFYFDKAGQNYESMLPFEKHIYLNNRGNSYYFRGDYHTALDYFRKSYSLVNSREEMEFERNLTMVNLGEIFILLNQTDSASYYLDRCYSFFKSINSASAIYYIETQLIELALKKGNIKEAKRIISKSINPDYIEPDMLLIRNKYLQHYYEKNKDFQKAYYYQNENIRLDDSIRNIKVKMKTSEIALRYKQDSILMKKEFSLIEKENELSRMSLWIYLLFLGILLVITVCITYIIYKKRINEKRIWSLKADINSMRLESIRNRISPHFIFNVLNREIVKHPEGSDKSSLTGLSKLIRKNLELTENQFITLKSELEFVSIYISIEKQNMGDNFLYDLQIGENIDTGKILLPSMFIQIPVENSIKHSLQIKKGAKRIWIKVEDFNDETSITITDNGGGFKTSSINKGTNTGLKVITQSIQLLNMKNKKQISMKISNANLDNNETGCEIKYYIPHNISYNQN